MRYLMLVCSDGEATPEIAKTMQEHMPAWVQEMDSSGRRLLGNGLLGPDAAKTVRVRDGHTVVSDGPFAETKEFIAGFDILEAENLDEAIQIAAEHPVSWYFSIELRPFGAGLQVPEQWAYEDLRYMLMMFDGDDDPPEVEAEVVGTREDWRDLAADELVVAHGLEHRDSATMVRVRDGEVLLTDGPFAETKEYLAGIAVLNTDDEQRAIELAAGFPLARFHCVEVRPFWGG